jgi:hypothetical protein
VWSKKEILECFNLPGIAACALILLIGGWTLRTVGFFKFSFISKDEHEACKLTRTKVRKKTQISNLNWPNESIF